MTKIIIALLALLAVNLANAQNKINQRKITAIKNNSSLQWYKTVLNNKNNAVQNTGSETIIGQRLQGALKVQVGANFIPQTEPIGEDESKH